MNNYTPNELNDIDAMKQRVMHNVVQELENSSPKPKYKWGVVMLTTVLTVSAMLFLFNQLFMVKEHSATSYPIDFTQPLIEEKQGIFYVHGITLGDSKTTVVELLGENSLTEIQEDGSGADLVLDYNGDARFYFYEEKLFTILLLNTNEDAFAKLYHEYSGIKFTSNTNRYLYLSETSHIIKAELTPMGTLHVSLSFVDPAELLENEGYMKLKEKKD